MCQARKFRSLLLQIEHYVWEIITTVSEASCSHKVNFIYTAPHHKYALMGFHKMHGIKRLIYLGMQQLSWIWTDIDVINALPSL